MFKITLQSGYSITAMIVTAIVAVGLVVWFYRRATLHLTPKKRWTLISLRIAVVMLVILLLFEPVIHYTKTVENRPGLAILLDRSASMRIADDASGRSRFDLARESIRQWYETLGTDFDISMVAFSQPAKRVKTVEELETLTPDGEATSLARAIRISRQVFSKESDPRAVILISDGIHNATGSPVRSAESSKIPIHTVGVGGSLSGEGVGRDVRLAGLDMPERLLLNNLAKITGTIEAVGLGGRLVSVLFERDEQIIERQELTLDDQPGMQSVTFEFRPEEKGRHTYTVRIETTGDERIEENNARSTVAETIEPGIRVLYVEGTLRPEYGALVERLLSKDPDLEFCALVQTRPNVFLTRTNIPSMKLRSIPSDKETLDKFDVFLIGDLDSSYLSTEQQERIIERVRDGAGLMMLGGYHSLGPGGYELTPLGRILPLRLGSRDIGQITEPFLPELTPEGVRHPIFTNIADYFPTAAGGPKQPGLPSLGGCTRVAGAKPGTTVLALCPVDENKSPVLAVARVDSGRAAVFTGDTTRRWQQGPRAVGQESPYLRFWGQTIRWLAGRDETLTTKAGLTASTDKAIYQPGEPVVISAVVRDKEGKGASKTKPVAVVAKGGEKNNGEKGSGTIYRNGPKGAAHKWSQTPLPLTPIPGPAGHYQVTFEPDRSGKYEIKVSTILEEETLQAELVTIEVGRPNLEFERLALDEKMLREIAEVSGGRYVHISTSDYLIDSLDRTARAETERLELRLFHPLIFWILFVGLLTTEWLLRLRMARLS